MMLSHDGIGLKLVQVGERGHTITQCLFTDPKHDRAASQVVTPGLQYGLHLVNNTQGQYRYDYRRRFEILYGELP